VDVVWLLIALAAAGIILALPILVLVQAVNTRRLAKQTQQRLQEPIARVTALETQIASVIKLVSRVYDLEREVERLKGSARTAEPTVAVPEPVAPPRPIAPPVEPGGAPLDSAAPPGAVPFFPPLPSAVPVVSAPPISSVAAYESKAPIASEGLGAFVPPPPRPASVPPQAAAAFSVSPKSLLSVEEALGTNWLNKLGVIILVIGVALFLAYELKALGPAGKILVGFAVSGVMLGAGIFFEQQERWRILARAGMGGGWALLYFTTYAMNHIRAARILDSESLDLFLLLIVAAAMVAHTLRYHSRVVTGLAFLLAFSTINISHGTATSLIASAILVLAFAVTVVRRRWFDLEVLGILAVFFNHFYWLRPIIEPMGSHHHPFPELVPSTALLISYWLIFRFSYIFRRIDAPEEENVSTVAALLNTFLFHYVIKYQSVHPELAFWFLLSVGSVELVLGQLPVTRRRRTAFVILSTIGVTLLVAAFPFRYSGGRLSVLWLMEAEAFFLAGVFTREILFRWLGILAQVLVAGHMLFVDARHLFDLRDARGIDFSDPRRALVFALAALILFVNAHWVPRRWPDLLQYDFEKKYFRFQSYVAGLVAVAGIWALCTEPWLAVGFGAIALALAIAGSRLKIEELSAQANCFALLAFLRAIFANFAVVEVSYFDLRAVSTIALVAALLYLTSRWIGFPDAARAFRIPQAFTWTATFVISLLVWYQLAPTSVALGWALLGLVLFELGFARRSGSLRLQSYLLFLSGFFRIFFVNFNAPVSPGELSPPLYTALPLAALFYYVYWRLAGRSDEFLRSESRMRAGDFHCYLGTITLAAVMRFELNLDWIAAAWAALVLLFVLIAWEYNRRIFLHQALLLAAGVFFRTVLHNFYQRSYFPAPSVLSGRWMTVGTSIVCLFLALLVGRRLRLKPAEGAAAERGGFRRALATLNRNPHQAFFFVSFILLTVLLYLELKSYGMSTVAWGAEAVAVFLFALKLKERSFRLSALALLLICVGKIVFVDVWGLTPRDRYLTFIVLGVALLSVSFLYTRYREVLRAYL
jgi:hypothetical protein